MRNGADGHRAAGIRIGRGEAKKYLMPTHAT